MSQHKPHQTAAEKWEQGLIDAYFDHRWRQLLNTLYARFERWRAGKLTHAAMRQAIRETHKESLDLDKLFAQRRSLLLTIIQWDRPWFEAWLADNPPPPGVELAPMP